MTKPALSVVIAAKNPNSHQLLRCIASFAALKQASKIEVLLALSGDSVQIPELLIQPLQNFGILELPANGVYPAYNAGAQAASGKYILFFGIDDIALPALDQVIEKLLCAPGDKHLIAAACHMQEKGIVTPSKWPPSLIFHNWCHQGLIYLRDYVANHSYDTKYKIRADHKMNIDIASNKNLAFVVEPSAISYFSSGGLSTTNVDRAFREDFPGIAAVSFGRSFGLIVALRQWLANIIHGDIASRVKQ